MFVEELSSEPSRGSPKSIKIQSISTEYKYKAKLPHNCDGLVL